MERTFLIVVSSFFLHCYNVLIMRYFYYMVFFALSHLSALPIQTDHAIFLFDNGDKNMIGSMLKYAEENEPSKLQGLDFRIVFMGASVDAMSQEPFCHYSEKLIHYKQLGVLETVDNTWKRDRLISKESLLALSSNLEVRRKVWSAVSCSIFTQLLHHYNSLSIETTAFRDNPSPFGDNDYFVVAKEVQDIANKVLVPSQAVADQIDPSKNVAVVGHGPIEEWQANALQIDPNAIRQRLQLNSHLPTIVYTGVYGDYYKPCLQLFLGIVPTQNNQILIVPHPRYKGVVETEVCADHAKSSSFQIIGEDQAKTVEVLIVCRCRCNR